MSQSFLKVSTFLNASARAHLRQMTADSRQPKINMKDRKLLASCYEYRGVLIDLYGEFLDDGVEVTDAALAGQDISLSELIDAKDFEKMSIWCENCMKREHADDW